MWNDEAIGPSLLTVNSNYFFIGIASALVIILAKVLGFPASPLAGEWPTHGWYFQLADCIIMLAAPIMLQTRSTFFVKALLVFALVATFIDAYSLTVLVWWFAAFLANTLTPAARAHQSVFQTLPYIVVLMAIIFFHLSVLTALFHVVGLLPDLKLEYNLGRLDTNGDIIDTADDAEDHTTND
jgi:hypothetical protein